MLARSQGRDVAAVLSESRSAKSPGRPVFGQVLDLVTSGKADGIICWKLDRVARNPVDGGAVIWAVDQSQLKEIVTPHRTFRNTGDDKFWMQLEFGMAKKYVDDLSDNVKRGNRAKLERGWVPGVPPIGYQNDRNTKTIVEDPHRYPLIERMLRHVLAGHPPISVLRTATDQWGLRTRRTRQGGNRPLSRTAFYELLGNRFYCGLIVRKGESFVGAHRPMITKAEFETIQRMLKRPSYRPRDDKAFPYRGLIRCGECGFAITASTVVKTNGARYQYYHCTKRRRDYDCHQRYVAAHVIDEQILDLLGEISIPARVRAWAMKRFASKAAHEQQSIDALRLSITTAIEQVREKVQRLLELFLNKSIEREVFEQQKEALVTEELTLKNRLDHLRKQAPPTWSEPAQRLATLANQAQKRFRVASVEVKREILLSLGQNLTISDGILRVQLQKPFSLGSPGNVSTDWSGWADAVITHFMEHPDTIQWPSFCKEDPSLQTKRNRSFNKSMGA